MSKKTDKSIATAPYGSFRTLTSFLNDLRDQKHVPSRIDRSSMPKLSGSAANETIATLRFFGFVQGDKDEPTTVLETYVEASDEDRKPMLEKIIREAYSFLFTTSEFNINRATAQQMAELFRTRGVNGSTLVRAVSLFLTAAKEAGIAVSPGVKAPVRSRAPNSGGRPKKDRKDGNTPPPDDEDPPPEEVHRFELPIPGKDSVIVLIPKALDSEDWDMFQQMFVIYVKRWKGFKEKEQKT
jgi:hypothetical protein